MQLNSLDNVSIKFVRFARRTIKIPPDKVICEFCYYLEYQLRQENDELENEQFTEIAEDAQRICNLCKESKKARFTLLNSNLLRRGAENEGYLQVLRRPHNDEAAHRD